MRGRNSPRETSLFLGMWGLAMLCGTAQNASAQQKPTRVYEKTFIGPASQRSKEQKGFQGVMDAVEMTTRGGSNLFGFVQDWNVLEPSPGNYRLDEEVEPPLTRLLPKHPKIEAVVFVLKMVDTGKLVVPDDLKGKAWDDKRLMARFVAS